MSPRGNPNSSRSRVRRFLSDPDSGAIHAYQFDQSRASIAAASEVSPRRGTQWMVARGWATRGISRSVS